MSIIVNMSSKHRLLVKGASELVLKACTHIYNSQTGQIQPINESLKEEMTKTIKLMADKALRTLALAYRELAGTETIDKKDNLGVYEIET
jgi:magnesium-transporting ATPase (P-type)